MDTYFIEAIFFGTCATFKNSSTYIATLKAASDNRKNKYDAKEAAEQAVIDTYGEKIKDFPGVRMKTSGENIIEFTFIGPGIFDIGRNSISTTSGKAVQLIKQEVDKNKDNFKEIIIKLMGRSRGGTTASLVTKKLKEEYEDEPSIKISLSTSDAYSGPLNRLQKKNRKFDVSKISSNHVRAVVVYSMGTQFNCTPMEINNADLIIITTLGHNDCHKLTNQFASSTLKGIFLDIDADMIYDTKRREIKIKTLAKYLPLIFLHEKRYSNREKILTKVIFKKLGIQKKVMEDFLSSLPNYRDEMKKIETIISSASNLPKLKQACEYIIDIFFISPRFLNLVKSNGTVHKLLVSTKEILEDEDTTPEGKCDSIITAITAAKALHSKKPFKRKIIEQLIAQTKKIKASC
ncbi:MAG: hypothetical protein NkDv07_0357 [Candidatus Improbicoccus devescovinae]|nr:MAG: hypothetical protein NkDv07_0357 [Candidatus Improbicoccus devescovinae]